MITKRKILPLIITFVMIVGTLTGISLPTFARGAAAAPTIYADGQKIQISQPIKQYSGDSFIAFSDISGFGLSGSLSGGAPVISKNGNSVSVTQGSNIILINGKSTLFNNPAIGSDNSLMISTKLISYVFGTDFSAPVVASVNTSSAPETIVFSENFDGAADSIKMDSTAPYFAPYLSPGFNLSGGVVASDVYNTNDLKMWDVVVPSDLLYIGVEPPSPEKVAVFNSNIMADKTDFLQTKAGSTVTVNNKSNFMIDFEFYLYNDNSAGTNLSDITPYYNYTGNIADNISFGETYKQYDPLYNAGWKKYTFSVPGEAFTSPTFYFGFAGYSKGGKKAYIDSVTISERDLTPPGTPTPTPPPMIDLTLSGGGQHWATGFIQDLLSKHVFEGYKNDDGTYEFRPDNPILRQEFVKVLTVAYGVYDATATYNGFSDVTADKWFYAYVASAVKEGLTQGKGDGIFGVDEKLSREQIVTFNGRALIKYYSCSIPSPAETTTLFANLIDSNLISDYAKGYVAMHIRLSIIIGYAVDGQLGKYEFRPQNDVTRGEVTKILSDTLNKV